MGCTPNKIKLRVHYIEGCLDTEKVLSSIDSLMASGDYNFDYEKILVSSPEQAKSIGFRGSPTIYINGRDIDEENSPPPSDALSCRYYPQGPPSVADMKEFIESELSD